VFVGPDSSEAIGLSLSDMQREAIRVATVARDLASPIEQDDAFASGLLHDIGYLVLALRPQHQFGRFIERVRAGESPLDVERDLFGVTHAEVGAHLLAIWGLPSTVVDSVQYHHDPGSAPEASRRVTSIVHVADASIAHPPVAVPLNLDSLQRAGCAHLATS
jgi:putative nucleotidyltransferase with HDIG domain